MPSRGPACGFAMSQLRFWLQFAALNKVTRLALGAGEGLAPSHLACRSGHLLTGT